MDGPIGTGYSVDPRGFEPRTSWLPAKRSALQSRTNDARCSSLNWVMPRDGQRMMSTRMSTGTGTPFAGCADAGPALPWGVDPWDPLPLQAWLADQLRCRCRGMNLREPCEKQATGEDGLCSTCRLPDAEPGECCEDSVVAHERRGEYPCFDDDGCNGWERFRPEEESSDVTEAGGESTQHLVWVYIT
jgi:hypothetical protein